ncbi:MAG TPA: flavin reductase family protein [Caulobacteraceae bacterium]|nr:flavin reductase family protein [Caulobacteraceae bacterium]
MADDTTHFYEPRNGHGLRHDPFNAIVAPRPIGWISSRSAAGVVNLAPYSFFNAFNYVPPIVGFASIGWKDSVANVTETGEFCWNLAVETLADQMNLTCAPAPAEIDEFEVAGLTHAPPRLVSVPRVRESPVNFECKMTQIVRLRTAAGEEVNAWLVMGEVVAVHIDRSVIAEGIYDTLAARPIMRAGGAADYFRITTQDRFQMRRPGWPIQ